MTERRDLTSDAILKGLGDELDRAIVDLRRMEDALRGQRPAMALQQVDQTVQELRAIAAICHLLSREGSSPLHPEHLAALTPRALIARLCGHPIEEEAAGVLRML